MLPVPTPPIVPVTFATQLHATVEVAADGTVRVVVAAEPGDVLEFVHAAAVADGEYGDMLGAGYTFPDEEDAAITAAWRTAEDAIGNGRCPVVIEA